MTFISSFRATELQSEPPVIGAFYSGSPPAGIYNEGLVTILESRLSRNLAEQWQWLLGSDAQPVACTAFGNFLFHSKKHGALFFIEVQRGKSTKVHVSAEAVFEEFLPSAAAQEHVLRELVVKEAALRLGALNYGECYIAEPWESIGGSGAVSTLTRGDVVVYNNLVGQAVRRSLDSRRMAQQIAPADRPTASRPAGG